MVQIRSIAASSYLNDTAQDKEYLNNSFLNENGIEIKDLTFELDRDNHAVLLRCKIDLKDSSTDLTIFAVRGSTTPIDWWLDFEIFLSSVLISVARWIPILQSYESQAAPLITHYMTFPLICMNEATLTYQYTHEMFDKIDNYRDKHPERTILFTSHSLGGGLAKVLQANLNF